MENETIIYKEEIKPFDQLPDIDLTDKLAIMEANQKPRVYIEEEKIIETIGIRESMIYSAMLIKSQPVTAITEDGQKIRVWDTEKKAYTFYLDDRGNPIKLKEVMRERVMEYYTVITRGGTATIFLWQNRKNAWLKYNPDTPGIRVIGTFISLGAAVRKIKGMSHEYKIVLKSCVNFSVNTVIVCKGCLNIVDPATGEVIESVTRLDDFSN